MADVAAAMAVLVRRNEALLAQVLIWQMGGRMGRQIGRADGRAGDRGVAEGRAYGHADGRVVRRAGQMGRRADG